MIETLAASAACALVAAPAPTDAQLWRPPQPTHSCGGCIYGSALWVLPSPISSTFSEADMTMNHTISSYLEILQHRRPSINQLPGHQTSLSAIDELYLTVRAALYAPDANPSTYTPDEAEQIMAAITTAAMRAARLFEPWLVILDAKEATVTCLRDLAHALRDILRLVDRYDRLPPGPTRDRVIVALGGKAEMTNA